MNNVDFSMVGESYVATKLDELGIRYWWDPSQRNKYSADFLTEYGIIDVKIADPQIKKYKSTITNKIVKNKYWRFNCHHHGIKQKSIDIFVFIVSGYKKELIYFVIPKEMVKSFTFSISEKQIINGRYSYFINNWAVLSNMDNRNVLGYKKKPNYTEISKTLNIKYARLYHILRCKIRATQEEKTKIKGYFKKYYMPIPPLLESKIKMKNKINWTLYKAFKELGYNVTTLSGETKIPYQRLRLIINGKVANIYNTEKDILAKILRIPKEILFKSE